MVHNPAEAAKARYTFFDVDQSLDGERVKQITMRMNPCPWILFKSVICVRFSTPCRIMESLMKTASKLLAAIFVVSSLSVVHAQTAGGQPATPSPQASPGGPMMGGDAQGIEIAMQKMQGEMAKIRATSDSAERQQLMAEHMSTMREAMGTMMKMGGPGTGMMPGGGMMRGDRGQPSTARGPDDAGGRIGMMEQRMGMMQMMMDQMMQHQEMMNRRQ
jgi:hypothetical protein